VLNFLDKSMHLLFSKKKFSSLSITPFCSGVYAIASS
jgi:hypothetical protein